MALILGLYLVSDLVQHKGLVRTMLPKKFPGAATTDISSAMTNRIDPPGKAWVKGVNTIGRLKEEAMASPGFECDVYFHLQGNFFDLHHDAESAGTPRLDSLLDYYQSAGLHSFIWLDFKNMRDSNYREALGTLIELRRRFGLERKILVESGRPDLLNAYADSGFYTIYYPPAFNPYLLSDDSLRYWTDYIAAKIHNNGINALSGYYYQYRFFEYYFPHQQVLLWAPNDRFSLVNRLFRWRINGDNRVPVCLYP